MQKTKIAWCYASWNPIVGCTKIAAGCANCYAERMAKLLKRIGITQYQDVVDENGWTGELRFVPKALDKPIKWRKPQQIFICSMGDLFHDKVEFSWIDEIAYVIKQFPQHTYIATTKRAKNMRTRMNYYYNKVSPPNPIPNLHLGISISTQQDLDANIGHLLDTPAAVRWISYEPAVEPIDITRWLTKCDKCGMTGLTPIKKIARYYCAICGQEVAWYKTIDWVVVGCESGPGRRPMKLEWALDLVLQCRLINIPVFVKQLEVDGSVTDDMSKFPKELQVREYSKRIKEADDE